MPLINRYDAKDLDELLRAFFAAPVSKRGLALRQIFVEKLDFEPATGVISLANHPKGVELPQTAERIASKAGVQVAFVPLALTDTDRVRKTEASTTAKIINDALHGDLLLLMTNGSSSQLHVIYPTFSAGSPTLRRMVIERDLPRRTVVEQLSNFYWDYAKTQDVRGALEHAFNVEAVTERFFETYRNVFERVEALITGFKDDEKKRLFTQRLFNRLMFIAFIQRKGWMRFNGDQDYLSALWKDCRSDKTVNNFYRDRLTVLFFAALNTKHEINLVDIPGATFLKRNVGDVPYLNGGLFEEDEDDKNTGITVPDQAIGAILMDLFARFNFTVMESTPLDVEVAVDPEMLGRVFEELVTGRHESGSYYTPKPVVSFMAREALKGYLETACPNETKNSINAFIDEYRPDGLEDAESMLAALKRVRVCDPACGSGAYLLGFLHELLDLRQALFATKGLDAPKVFDRKLEIIQNNLYGVDIDPFAVNIARLRLWLSLAVDFEGGNPPPLPNLDFKIEAGDSLTAPNPQLAEQRAFRDQLVKEFRTAKAEYMVAHGSQKVALWDKVAKLRADISQWTHGKIEVAGFDWAVEFADVFESGGFDVAIANPPYISALEFARTRPRSQRESLNSLYESAQGAYDYYVLFFERALQLLRKGGILSFITPNKYLSAPYAKGLRGVLATHAQFLQLADLSCLPVFRRAQVYPVLSLFRLGNRPNGRINLWHPRTRELSEFRLRDYSSVSVPAELLEALPDRIWGFLLSNQFDLLLNLIRESRPLGEIAEVRATTTAAEADAYSSALVGVKPKDGFRVVNTGTIDPFVSLWDQRPLRDGGRKLSTPYIPSAQVSPQRRELYAKPKIIFAKIAKHCEAMLDDSGEYAGLNVNCLSDPRSGLTLEYVLAYVHSPIFHFLYGQFFGALRMAGGDFQFQAPQLRVIPLRIPDSRLNLKVTTQVRKLCQLLKDGVSAESSQAKLLVSQIDSDIVSLYRLTDNESSRLLSNHEQEEPARP